MPIFKFLRRTDTGSPTLGKLYSGWFELGEFLKSNASAFQKLAQEKWMERWAYGHRDVSAAAYMVDPEFHSHDQASNSEVTAGFMKTLEKLAILMEVRRREQESPGELEKEWKTRLEFLKLDKKNWRSFDHYPSYPDKSHAAVKTFCRKVSEQLHLYRNRKGIFASEWVFDSAENACACVVGPVWLRCARACVFC